MSAPDIAPGAPCWIDLMTSDPEKAKDFYARLFGWTYETGDQEKYGGYIMAFKDGQPVAGLMKNDGTSGYPDVWTTYLRVEDIEAAANAAAAHGGQILMGPMEVPEQGQMAMIGDPGGAAVGLWQFGGHTGFKIHDVSGSPVWHELQTRSYDESVQFYRAVFGWDTEVRSDSPQFRYTTLGTGDHSTAGIMDSSAHLPEGVPSHWQVYFGVDNADATIEKALSLGGRLVEPLEDSPFGRMAGLADPTGTMFKIAQRGAHAG